MASGVNTLSASAATATPSPAASSWTDALRVLAWVRSSACTSENARLLYAVKPMERSAPLT